MTKERFLQSAVVKEALKHDQKLVAAIEQAQAFLPTFCDVFSKPAFRQVDFLATALESRGQHFVPIGIAVDQIHDGVISGACIPHRRLAFPSGRVSCGFDQVVELRYTDAFMCEGGFVYKELCRRLPFEMSHWILDDRTFLLEWDSEVPCDHQFREFLRHIANHRCDEALRMVTQDPSLSDRYAFVPRPGHSKWDPRSVLVQTTAGEYAAEFGDREMILRLHDAGVVREDAGGRAPLGWSALRGNLETTAAMLELGYDVNVVDKHNISPLDYAAMYGRADVVDLLIRHGSNIDRRDNRQMTPLFHAETTDIARKLLEAGAATDLKDDVGRDCVAWHNSEGRADIVELLVKCGAHAPRKPRGPNAYEIMARGGAELDELELLELGYVGGFPPEAEDYGFVLPVKTIDTSERP